MFVWMSSYMSMCKGKQKTTAGLIPQAWYIFFFYSRDSDMWNSSRIQGWESASTKDLLTPSPPPWDCSYVSPFLVSMEAWRETELGSSYFQGKYFTDWDISQQPWEISHSFLKWILLNKYSIWWFHTYVGSSGYHFLPLLTLTFQSILSFLAFLFQVS